MGMYRQTLIEFNVHMHKLLLFPFFFPLHHSFPADHNIYGTLPANLDRSLCSVCDALMNCWTELIKMWDIFLMETFIQSTFTAAMV